MDRSDLKPTEAHPAAYMAMDYIKSLPIGTLQKYLESFASCSLAGNRLGEICAGTINRLLNNQPVSDRYLCGLAWAILEMEKTNGDNNTTRK